MNGYSCLLLAGRHIVSSEPSVQIVQSERKHRSTPVVCYEEWHVRAIEDISPSVEPSGKKSTQDPPCGKISEHAEVLVGKRFMIVEKTEILDSGVHAKKTKTNRVLNNIF